MTQEINTQLAETIFYTSPTKKIHTKECRHYQPDKAGWQQVNSILTAIDEGYQICRICCPTETEIDALRQQVPSFLPKSSPSTSSSSTTEKIASDSKSGAETREENQPQASNSLNTSPDTAVNDNLEAVNQQQPEQNQPRAKTKSAEQEKQKNKADSQSAQQQKLSKPKSSKPKQHKKPYKILAGNGCHQAIAEVQGILVPPTEDQGKFKLILADGTQLEAIFRNPRLKWIAHNQDWLIGAHWFRGYPKMKDNKLVGFQIIAWDGNMPTNEKGWELWEFIGVWTVQKNLTVQRSMMDKEIRQIAKETGFIKKFKYNFTNSHDWLKNKKLWVGYVYKLICRREGDTLKIQKVIPFACPRIKPVPHKNKSPQGKFKSQPNNK